MEFLTRLFRRGSSGASPTSEDGPTELVLPSTDRFRLQVVGESHYQQALEQICGGRTEEGANLRCVATLVLDDENPYDRNAVRVEIHGRHVGHLNREDAKAYRKFLQDQGAGANVRGICKAWIRGGWERGDDRGHFGVFLDFELYG
ncbi:MAG TPA: HIRAN domain-containing protein [bacterium]|nr:HIRAN domain-containing protein [bacterium]